jgi:hypothetical protein
MGTNLKGTKRTGGGMGFMILALVFGKRRMFVRHGHAIRVYRFAGRNFVFA